LDKTRSDALNEAHRAILQPTRIVTAFKQIPHYSASAWKLLRHGGHVHDYEASRFLTALCDYRQEWVIAKGARQLPTSWMLPFRDDFRKIIAGANVATVEISLTHGDAELRPLLISLLSGMVDRFRTRRIAAYMNDPSPAVRKRVAKALRRMEAWSLLKEMSHKYPDDRSVQWFAQPRTSQFSFAQRLERFSRCVDRSNSHQAALASRMPLWFSYEPGDGKPAKTAAYIRRLLLRIRRLVHGEESSSSSLQDSHPAAHP
jgi:hypothetical protein